MLTAQQVKLLTTNGCLKNVLRQLLNELVKLGINRDNISTVGKGGVDELSPVSFNRRATVQITE